MGEIPHLTGDLDSERGRDVVFAIRRYLVIDGDVAALLRIVAVAIEQHRVLDEMVSRLIEEADARG